MAVGVERIGSLWGGPVGAWVLAILVFAIHPTQLSEDFYQHPTHSSVPWVKFVGIAAGSPRGAGHFLEGPDPAA